jgi:uncharacterized membrane protein YqjE
VAEERSVSDVLQDVLRNLEDIVRSEIRLARVEIREEVRGAVSSSVWIAVGAVGAVSASTLLLWTLAYALATRMPIWAATLVVAVVIAVASMVLIVSGIRRAKRIQPIPERTVKVVKENLEWMKQPTK